MVERWTTVWELCVPGFIGLLTGDDVCGVLRDWGCGWWPGRINGCGSWTIDDGIVGVSLLRQLERSNEVVEVLEVLAPSWVISPHTGEICFDLCNIQRWVGTPSFAEVLAKPAVLGFGVEALDGSDLRNWCMSRLMSASVCLSTNTVARLNFSRPRPLWLFWFLLSWSLRLELQHWWNCWSGLNSCDLVLVQDLAEIFLCKLLVQEVAERVPNTLMILSTYYRKSSGSFLLPACLSLEEDDFFLSPWCFLEWWNFPILVLLILVSKNK